MDELKEKLKLAECPFNWGLSEIKDRKSATFIIERLLEKEEEISEPWIHVCINLTIAYLHSENQDVTKAIGILKECDGILNSSTDNLIIKYKPALQSVCNASRASILVSSSTPSEVKIFADKIVRVEDLDIPNQAAIHAIKANVFLEFGVSGSTIALQHAKDALKKNSNEADWHFLMGKLYSRLRHFTQDHEITAAEISHMQKAFNLAGTSRSAIFLANAYIEKSRTLNSISYKNGNRPNNDVRNQIKQLTAEAKALIKLALEKNQNQCVHILIRCAFAYSKLPRFDRECDTAKQLIEESLKRSPCNPMANKLAGDLCLQDDKPQYHKALKHFEIAASRNVFSANFAAFDIKVKLSLNPEVEPFYAKILAQFTENNYQMLTFIHATEYYLFIRRDLCAAVSYFMKAIELDPNFHALTDRWVKYIQKNVNYYELISNEVRHSIDSQMFHDINQLNILKNALKKISEVNPKLLGVPVVPNKVQGYLDTFEQESKNPSGRGRGRGRGRGFGRGAGRGGRGRGRGGQSQSERNVDFISQNRGSGRTRSGERRGMGPRNRSSSRNRVGSNINDSNENYNNQSKFDQSQFNRLSYAHDKTEENLENPYYIKFLELKYKKMTRSESFAEWLQEYGEAPSGVVKSNKASKKEKGDKNSSAKSQEAGNSDAYKMQELISIINQLKEEVKELKFSETRSCCSSARYRREPCHSLKSLEYNEFDKVRKHRADYSSYDRYMDTRDRYSRSRRSDDRHRWRSEDRNAKYNRMYMEKNKYAIERGYYVSPEREVRRRSVYESDSNSDSGPRYSSSHDRRVERRSRKSSFPDRRMEHNSSRQSSPTYSKRMEQYYSRHSSPTYNERKPRRSSHRRMSEDRREHLHHSSRSSSSSSQTDSERYPSLREEKKRRQGSVDSAYLRYRRNSVSETEKGDKHSKHKKTEKSDRRLYEETLKKGSSKSVKKEALTPSSSKSSSDENRDVKKVDSDDQNSDREPCLGYGKVKYADKKKDDLARRSYKEHDCSSSDSGEKSLAKKSYPKNKDKVKRDLEYERSLNESSERSHKHYNEKYSSSGSHKIQNTGSRDNKKYLPSNGDPRKIFSSEEFVERKSHHLEKPSKEHTRDEASFHKVRKSHESDKPETFSRKSSNVRDSTYSQFDTKQVSSSRKGTSISRSSSEWENIGHQEMAIARSETNRHDKESRYPKSLSGDEYEKTSSG